MTTPPEPTRTLRTDAYIRTLPSNGSYWPKGAPGPHETWNYECNPAVIVMSQLETELATALKERDSALAAVQIYRDALERYTEEERWILEDAEWRFIPETHTPNPWINPQEVAEAALSTPPEPMVKRCLAEGLAEAAFTAGWNAGHDSYSNPGAPDNFEAAWEAYRNYAKEEG